jgi:hypothetical protein
MKTRTLLLLIALMLPGCGAQPKTLDSADCGDPIAQYACWVYEIVNPPITPDRPVQDVSVECEVCVAGDWRILATTSNGFVAVPADLTRVTLREFGWVQVVGDSQ